MNKYDIVGKIVNGNEVIGYRIQQTFSVFYVSPIILSEGIEDELIFPCDKQLIFPFHDVVIVEYKDIEMNRGRIGQERFKEAIEETTLNDLREAIEHNKKYGTLIVEIEESNRVIRRYSLVPEKDIIYPIYNSRKQLLKTRFDTIYELVDFIVSVKDKEYENIKDIIEYIKKGKTESSSVYSFKIEIK